MYPRRTRKSGFTLIELLVVIAIIAVLIGFLMPALSSAREQSRQLVCRNNLRNIWTGIRMYAQSNIDRVPYIEDYDPNDDPFDPEHPTAAGTVLEPYVQPGSWVCPSAVAGFPANAPGSDWKMTYWFFAARNPREPYDVNTESGSGPAPKYITNYNQFDGRPIDILDGRRYGTERTVANYRVKYNLFWRTRWPLLRDSIITSQNGLFVSPLYPHRGNLNPRADLHNAQATFQRNTHHKSARTGYLGLFSDGTEVDIFLTRIFLPHAQGY